MKNLQDGANFFRNWVCSSPCSFSIVKVHQSLTQLAKKDEASSYVSHEMEEIVFVASAAVSQSFPVFKS